MFISNPPKTDIIMRAIYKESMVSMVKDDHRIALIKYIQNVFGISIDHIQLNVDNKPSSQFIKITKGYGPSLFSLSFGLEETSVTLWDVSNIEEATDLFGKAYKMVEEIPLQMLRINVSQHFAADDDPEPFFISLNPKIPDKFESLIASRGVFYTLAVEEEELEINITVVKSLYFDNGIFVAKDYNFRPQDLDIDRISRVIMDYDIFLLNQLGIQTKFEGR